MPYIKAENREKIVHEYKGYPGSLTEPPEDPVFVIDGNQIDNAGELNFAISKLIKNYLDNKGIQYQYLNEVIGVLECAKLELYRRVISPYENEKIEDNGDVY